MSSQRVLGGLAALNGFLAVALGAYGSHLAADAQAADWFRTATAIQLPHAAVVLALLGWRPAAVFAPWLLGIGSLLFATTLQALALGAPAAIAYGAPVGGTLMLAGWLAVAVTALRS